MWGVFGFPFIPICFGGVLLRVPNFPKNGIGVSPASGRKVWSMLGPSPFCQGPTPRVSALSGLRAPPNPDATCKGSKQFFRGCGEDQFLQDRLEEKWWQLANPAPQSCFIETVVSFTSHNTLIGFTVLTVLFGCLCIDVLVLPELVAF